MASTLATVKDDGIPPLPPHWIFDGEQDSPYYTGSFRQRVVLAMYRLLCLVTFGEKSLRPLWKRNHMVDARAWEYGRDMLKDRIQHTNIVAGLLLTTIAAFCTTDPPKDSKLFPYTKEGPTCLLLLAFGCSFAGLIVGSAHVAVIGGARSAWFCNVLLGTRARIWLTMILLGYPFWAIAASTCSLAAGLLVAASYSESPLIRYGGYGVLVTPLSCAFAFAWILTIRNGARLDSVDAEKV